MASATATTRRRRSTTSGPAATSWASASWSSTCATREWPRNEPVNLKVDVGTGHALVLVPADVCLQANSHAGLGYVNLLGSETGGADIDEQRGTLARSPSARKLILDADVGIGAIEVRHTRTDNGHWDNDRHGPDQINDTLAAAGCAGERA